MTNEKPTNLKAEADKVYKILAKKNPSVEEVKKITYLVNQMARQNARIGGTR